MDKVIIKTGCIIALAVAALMVVADVDAETYDPRNPICIPQGDYDEALTQAYSEGLTRGQRIGYTYGGVDTAKYILEIFAEKCTESGTEIELSSGIVVVCK